MMEHSILPPSSAHIWGKPGGCPGWVIMHQLFPDDETEDARQGTASHEIAAHMVTEAAQTGHITEWSVFDGGVAENGVPFDDEMYEAAREYAEDVLAVMRSTGNFVPNVETRVTASQIHEVQFGTSDCFLFDRPSMTLYIWDYKFGHRLVEAFENWQGMCYYAGILNTLNIDGIEDRQITVRIRIAQPRGFHRDGTIREWVINGGDLRPYVNQLHMAAAEALSNEAECRTGEHCRDCNARTGCGAAISAGMSLYEAACQPVPLEMSPDAMGLHLALLRRAKNQLEYLEAGFAEVIESAIKAGKNVPGWMTEDTFGRQKWDKPTSEVIAMGHMFGVDLRKQDCVTPNQAKKLGVDETVIKAYSSTPRTGLKLVPDNGNKVRKVFSK